MDLLVFISNKDMIYIIKMIKPLEDTGVLIDAKTVKDEIKKTRRWIS